MPWLLSLPALLALAWGIAGLLWWDGRRQVIGAGQRPWIMAALALVALAMALAVLAVPAPWPEQSLRGFLLLEAGAGMVVLVQRGRRRG